MDSGLRRNDTVGVGMRSELPMLRRHSRAGGNPVHDAQRARVWRVRHWIPAFAGMTAWVRGQAGVQAQKVAGRNSAFLSTHIMRPFCVSIETMSRKSPEPRANPEPVWLPNSSVVTLNS
jgi:hypothetical protein